MSKRIAFRNFLDTVTSFFRNDSTTPRVWTLQDRDGTIADDTDLNLKANAITTLSSKTDDYTLTSNDLTDVNTGKALIFEFNKATAITFTIPPNSSVAFSVGTIIWVKRIGTGVLTIGQGSGVTVTGSSGSLTDAGLNVTMYLRKTGTDTWDLQNGSPGTWSDWSTTFTGFSVVPTSVVFRYVIEGKTCRYWFTMGGNGTSNANTFTMTMPFAAKSAGANQFNLLPTVVDNGSVKTTPGRIQFTAGSNIATLGVDAGGNAWTSSGGKRSFGSGLFEID